MLTKKRLLSICVLTVCLCCSVALAQAQTVAFVNVNVIPMDSERVLTNHTVIIQDGTITEIGLSDQITIPEGAETVDGEGGFLMPGLADMHTHLSYFDMDPRQLILYLAEGTTTARTMSGSDIELKWRNQIEAGELLGPSLLVGRTIFGNEGNGFGLNTPLFLFRLGIFALPLTLVGLGMLLGFIPKELLIGAGAVAIGALSWLLSFPAASPVMVESMGRQNDAFFAESPPQAVMEVERMHNAGFDFLKVYDGVSLAMFQAIVSEAQELGLYAAGHLPDQISMETAFKAGYQEVAHVDELLSFHWMGYDPSGEIALENMRFGFPINHDTIPETVSLIQAYDIPVVANLSTDEAMERLIFDTPGVLLEPKFDVVPPELREFWRTSGRNVGVFRDQGPYRRDEGAPFLKEMTLALHKAGVLITIGTDTSSEGCIPSDIHRELELLVEVGFTSYEALEAGTKVASLVVDRMGKGDHFGTIEVGKRADLILLHNNPLEDVSNTRDRKGVMARGNWYSQDKLDAMVQSYIEAH